MGSSPVTATTTRIRMDLLHSLETFFRPPLSLERGDRAIVAFSGGADSTALLWGMARLAARRGAAVVAAHVDHGLDAGSAARADAAAATAERLGVPCVRERRPVPLLRAAGESVEAAARRVRYAALEAVRARHGARWVATAHHRDDQAETVLLRLLYGSGLAGLAGVRPVHGTAVRPLLGLPRAALAAAVAAAGLTAVADPTNGDLAAARNRVRHQLLPALSSPGHECPGYPGSAGQAGFKKNGGLDDLASRLARLAERARGAGAAVERALAPLLLAQPLAHAEDAAGIAEGVAVPRRALAALPAPLLPFALAALHRRAGAPYPAGGAARGELLRQLAAGRRIACDCGGGWRWSREGGLLTLRRAPRREPPHDFTYTLEIPGELEVPELAVTFALHHRPVAPWMFAGAPHRAGLALPLVPGDRVTVRNRRPGDRLRPLGARGSRRLKEVLVDRRVPRPLRDRIPLLCVGERIAWVPGVTIDHGFRLRGETTAWVAEILT